MKSCLFLCSFGSRFTQGLSLKEAVDLAVDYGFQAVEPYPVNELSSINLTVAKEFGEYCSKKGIDIPCFSMLGSLEGKDYKEEVERLKSFVDVAYAMGAKMFHHTLVPSLRHTAEHMPIYKQILPQLISACEEICDYAAKYDITCVYEDQGFVINGVRAYEEFYLSLDRPNKGIISDLGNILFVGEKPQDFTGHFAPLVKHVHVKDYLLKSGNSPFPGSEWYVAANGDYIRGTVIGHGIIDFVQTIKILLRAGYDGYYSIEFDGIEPPEIGITNGLRNLQYYYEEAVRQISLSKERALL